MYNDYENVPVGNLVIISTDVDEEINGRYYLRVDTPEHFSLKGDLSGAQGIQGPQGPQGIQGPQGPQGIEGPTGPTGNGISTIAKTSTTGLVDTYTITFSDGTTSTYEVTNGEVSEEDLEQRLYENTQMLYNALPTISGNGEEITLDGTAEVLFRKIDLKGNTYQYSTIGKNLFDKTTYPMEQGSFDYNNGNNSNSDIRIRSPYFAIQPNTTYTISCNTNIGEFAMIYKQSDNITLIRGSSTNYNNQKYATFTTPDNAYYMKFRMGNQTNTKTSTTDYEIQLEEGTEATPYEQYTGGNPAPNPDYPQDIQVVSGDNTIKVEGKNLFDKATITENKYLDINGVEQNDNTKCYSDYIAINSNNNYITNQMGNWGGVCTCYYDTNKTFISAETGTTVVGNNNIFTIPSNAYYMRVSTNQSWLDITQIELGSTTTTYEPYQSQSYPINLGVENLYNGTYSSTAKKLGVVATRQDDGSYSLSGTCSSPTLGANADFVLGNCTLEAGTYVISGYPNKTGIRLRYRPTAGSWTGVTYVGETGLVITLNQQSTIDLVISVENETNTNGTIVYPQIEKGTKKNSFTPYGTTPIELCKIGTYQDRIYKDNGKWYLNKQIGKVVLNGSESWNTGNPVNRYNLVINSQTITSIKPLSNYFIGTITNPTINDNAVFLQNVDSLTMRINLYNKDYLSNLSGFKSWLSTHNTEVYYVLATPTYEEITDTTLIEQLDNLEKAYSYDTQTNISQTNGDMPFILDVEAIMSLRNVLNSLETRIAVLETE